MTTTKTSAIEIYRSMLATYLDPHYGSLGGVALEDIADAADISYDGTDSYDLRCDVLSKFDIDDKASAELACKMLEEMHDVVRALECDDAEDAAKIMGNLWELLTGAVREILKLRVYEVEAVATVGAEPLEVLKSIMQAADSADPYMHDGDRYAGMVLLDWSDTVGCLTLSTRESSDWPGGVWAYTDTHALWGDCARDLEIIPRAMLASDLDDLRHCLAMMDERARRDLLDDVGELPSWGDQPEDHECDITRLISWDDGRCLYQSDCGDLYTQARIQR